MLWRASHNSEYVLGGFAHEEALGLYGAMGPKNPKIFEETPGRIIKSGSNSYTFFRETSDPIGSKINIEFFGPIGIRTHNLELIYTPSPLGAQLFLWAHGEGQRLANDIFNPNLELKTISV